MNFDMLHPADQIVMIMNRIYYYGMTTTTGGNLSIRDSEGTVWISPTCPACADAAPANAANIEPMKANDEPRNTGLLNFVKSR